MLRQKVTPKSSSFGSKMFQFSQNFRKDFCKVSILILVLTLIFWAGKLSQNKEIKNEKIPNQKFSKENNSNENISNDKSFDEKISDEKFSAPAFCGGQHFGKATQSIFFSERNKIYSEMESEFEKKGPFFLKKGETSQSLKLNDIFELDGISVKPKLKEANPPVRANILFIDPKVAVPIKEAVEDVLKPYFPGGVWYQDPFMYHLSLFHSSHHMEPVPPLSPTVAAELAAVQSLCTEICPLWISLDRVVLTATGVLLACWQLRDGTEPSELREKLRKALPNAPKKQMYNKVMLHTSFARILLPPIVPKKRGGEREREGNVTDGDTLSLLKNLVSELNHRLCRKQAEIRELWFVEELDLLALALKGRFVPHKFNLSCKF